MTKVAIHQPNFLPWLGYFYKIHLCDIFIILDDVQFVKRGYINRATFVRPDNEPHLISIPLKKHSLTAAINEVYINHDQGTRDIFLTLSRFYKNKKNNKRLEDINLALKNIGQFDKLVDLNVFLLQVIIKAWFPSKKVIFSSTFGVKTKGEQKMIDLVKAVDGDEYISGMGAKSYQSAETFLKNQVKLTYVDYPNLSYKEGARKLLDGYSVYDFVAFETDLENFYCF